MTIVGTTVSSRTALNHLRSIKPNDGWSIKVVVNETQNENTEELQLLRRNVPIADMNFVDIHHDPKTNSVVGLLTKDAMLCHILVDGKTGRPVVQTNKNSQSVEYISCAHSYPGYKALTEAERQQSGGSQQASSSSSWRTASTASSQRSNNSNENSNPAQPLPEFWTNLTEEEKKKYKLYATMAIGFYIVSQILISMFGSGLVFFCVVPALYLYGIQTCPDPSSFDTKKEVKRVLRGHHLPDDHPSKPQKGNLIEEWTAKITASVATEVSAAAGGHELEMIDLLGGCARMAIVTVPTLNTTYEWIGCNDTWYHLRAYNTPNNNSTR